MHRIRLFVAASSLSLLAACGGSDKSTGPGNNPGPGPEEPSSAFGAKVTDGPVDSLKGKAFFAYEDGMTDVGFALGLGVLTEQTTNNPGWLVVYRETQGLPAAGNHAIADDTGEGEEEPGEGDFVIAGMLQPGHADQRLCASVSGTLSITSRANDRLKGTITATLRCYKVADFDDTIDVGIQGTYDAAKGIVAGPNF
jgi:hypothetical protein